MELKIISFDTGYNIIMGQSHFIKTVEDLYEAVITSYSDAKFGIAFCEASQKSLIRYDGTDDEMKQLAVEIAKKVRAGHFFVITLKNLYPINVLNAVKQVPEVVTIFCATQNPVDVIVAEENGRRGVLGVIDGRATDNVENDEDRKERHEFLRKIGYKK